MENNKIEIGGLWEQVSKDGKPYYSGSFGRAKLLIFQNKWKEEGSNQPDWKMYIVPAAKKKEDQSEGTTYTAADQPTTTADIPF